MTNEWPMPNDLSAPDADDEHSETERHVDEVERAGGERNGAPRTPDGEPHSTIVAPMPRREDGDTTLEAEPSTPSTGR